MTINPTVLQPLRINRTNSWAKSIVVVLAIFAIASALYAPTMVVHFPGLDESAYLHRGALLIEQGILHPLSANPAPTILNGAIYSLYHQNRLQLEDVSTMRRWLTLFLLVSGTFYAASKCGVRMRYAAIAALIVGTSPTLRFIINNSSDSLYAIFLIYSFGWAAGEIRGIKDRRPTAAGNYLLFGLSLAGLALSRDDGFIVGPLALLFYGFILQKSGFRFGARISSAAAAFSLPICLWMVLWGIQSGDWNTHIPERSYNAFCQGQNILFAGQFIDSPGIPTAVSIFGTGKENGDSLVRAVLHHPREFAFRLRRLPGNLRDSVVNAYGGKAACAVSAVFLLIGLVVIAYSKERLLLVLCGIWLLPLAVYPLTFYRPGYFAMNFPVLCTLSICGIASLRAIGRIPSQQMAALIFVAFALIVNGVQVWRGERLQNTGQPTQYLATSRWVSELQRAVPRNTMVVAVDPSMLWYAHLEHSEIPSQFIQICTPLQFTQYMRQNRMEYVVVDQSMRSIYPHFAEVVTASGLQPIVSDTSFHATLYRISQ